MSPPPDAARPPDRQDARGPDRRAVLAVIGLSAGLAACGSLPRQTAPIRLAHGVLLHRQDPRILASDNARLRALFSEAQARFAADDTPRSLLALSGGGASGAYGAGVLYGWSQSGSRPAFDIVTGVSTGALAAPFAFLGAGWDEALRAAYVDGGASGLLSLNSFRPLISPSLFSSARLRMLIWRNVTADMLRAIAAEHAKGRRLLVATTNLDTEETVIWDLGLLASQGDDSALTLFRQVLLASASIPGVFPPVLIRGVGPDGSLIEEMHVDGGVNTPFLAVPSGMLLWTAPTNSKGGDLYVLINGQIDRPPSYTKGTFRGILTRSYESAAKAATRAQLAANAAFADRNGLRLHVAAIPRDQTASSLDFDRRTMRDLFERGRAQAAQNKAWTDVAVGSAVPEVSAPPAPPPTGPER